MRLYKPNWGWKVIICLELQEIVLFPLFWLDSLDLGKFFKYNSISVKSSQEWGDNHGQSLLLMHITLIYHFRGALPLKGVLETVTTPFAKKTQFKASVPSSTSETLEVTVLGSCWAYSALKADQNANMFHSPSKVYIKEWKWNVKPRWTCVKQWSLVMLSTGRTRKRKSKTKPRNYETYPTIQKFKWEWGSHQGHRPNEEIESGAKLEKSWEIH